MYKLYTSVYVYMYRQTDRQTHVHVQTDRQTVVRDDWTVLAKDVYNFSITPSDAVTMTPLSNTVQSSLTLVSH